MSGLPEGVANGPSQSDYLEKDARIWERPWTLEEMQQSSANWSLAADSGLFLFLQDFSQRMLSKTHDIEKQLDSLIRDTKATDSCLQSVFNDFLMLSNTQFIENRVYDEEVVETISKADALDKQPEQEKTREQKEAELIPKMQEAVNYGLRVLESAFEHLDIKAGNSDSEDEEATDRVEAILEPKDLYVDRPLPYLIGSQAFMEQDDVGLGDLSSDEMSVDSERDSVIESEDEKDANHSDEDFNPKEDDGHNNFRKKSSMMSYEDDEEEEEEDEDSDIFGESEKEDDDDDDNENTKNAGPSSFADELAARIKGEAVHRQEGDRASLSSKKKSKARKESKSSKSQAAEDDNDDMFKPPKMDDEDDFSPFGGKGGLFSGGRGLFDDDDEGDLFAEVPKPEAPKETKAMNESVREPAKPGKKIPAGGISIFPDNSLFSSGNDSDLAESKENGAPVPKASVPPQKMVSKESAVSGGGLFDDEDDDDDFFGGKGLKKSDSVVKEKPKAKVTIDLFTEDDEDDGNIFSPPTPVQNNKDVVAEPAKPPEKKMPAGAISMFGPGTKSLLSEGLRKRQQSTSEESEKSEENGPATDVRKSVVKPSPKPLTRGLFSDDEETQNGPAADVRKPTVKQSPKPQSRGLFSDDEDTQNGPAADIGEPVVKPSPKPQTRGLFSDDEDAQNGPTPNVGKSSAKPSLKPQSRGLFSDDEDNQVFPTIPRSQSKPEPTSHSKTNKGASLLFDDEEDEDLFASAAKSKPKTNQAKASPLQTSSAASSSLFSDDEDQWLGTATKLDTTAGAMKPSVSAPSKLSSAKITRKSSLFDNEEEDVEDLFAPTKESSQKKPMRAALLFEEDGDDHNENKGSLFGINPTVNRNTAPPPAITTPAPASESQSLPQKSDVVAISSTAAEIKPPLQEKPTTQTPQVPAASESKKKPAGAVSLFGGISVLEKQTKTQFDEDGDDDDDNGFGPPPLDEEEEEEEKEEDKVKAAVMSLFEDEDEDESEWSDPFFTPRKPAGKNTQKKEEEAEERQPQAKSTGVFQDEELLFSHTQQKDNDPDVDLFATSGKNVSSAKAAAHTGNLFSEDDEEDLFSSTKPKAPPKVADKPSKSADTAPLASPESVSEIQKPAPGPVKPKDSSRIGKLQANLKLNPAALLPGAAPIFPGAISVMPGMGTSSSSGVSSSSLSPSPATTPVGALTDSEGVSFDTPVQVTTLQSAQKSRTKGAVHRRPQTRAARQQAAQRSVGDGEEDLSPLPGPKSSLSDLVFYPPDKSSQTSASPHSSTPTATALSSSTSSQPAFPKVSPRPSVLTLPVKTDTGKKDSGKVNSKVLPSSEEDDIFGSDSLFEATLVSNTPSSTQSTKRTPPEASAVAETKTDTDKSTFLSIFDDNTDDLFQKVKPRSTTKKAKASSFLEDDDEDLFGVSSSSTPSSTSSKEIKNGTGFSKQDIFQEDVATVPTVQKKHKEKTIDVSLFDDDLDIFADLSDTLKPKQKLKTKGETKSIFDVDTDDIFSTTTAKTAAKAPHKSKKTSGSQESSAAAAGAAAAESTNIFDDPLNALGGN